MKRCIDIHLNVFSFGKEHDAVFLPPHAPSLTYLQIRPGTGCACFRSCSFMTPSSVEQPGTPLRDKERWLIYV